ncbi:MAG: hypothetical protein ABIL68_02945 [bacterium]
MDQLILPIVAIIISVWFFHMSRRSENRSRILLEKITTKTDILETISRNLIVKLIDFSTYRVADLVENLSSAINQNLPEQKLIEPKNENELIEQLYISLIRKLFFVYLANCYLVPAMMKYSSFKSIPKNLVNNLNLTYSEFNSTLALLEKVDQSILKSLTLYENYVSIKQSKDEIYSYDKFIEKFKYIIKDT